jgi:hypothetical protein
MRFVAADGRASLVRGGAVFDVAECSDGAIPADPMSVLRDYWDDLAALALAGEGRLLGEVTLGAPVPRPPLILSLIANYPPAGKSGFPIKPVSPGSHVITPSLALRACHTRPVRAYSGSMAAENASRADSTRAEGAWPGIRVVPAASCAFSRLPLTPQRGGASHR